MSKIEFKKIISKDMLISWDDSGLLKFNDEYVLTDSGVLIDNNGNLIWNFNLEHRFSKAIYIKEREIIITNRTICFGMGGDFHLGIACIDMKTGKYRWKHFYDAGTSRATLKNRKQDINMVRNIGIVDIVKGYIYADGFEINLDNGSYKYIGNLERKKTETDNIIYSKIVKSIKVKLDYHSENVECIKVKVDAIYIEGQKFSKDGYFFNKCNFYMSSNESIFLFGTPAKKNPKNAVLFKYSKNQKNIIEEIQLPLRSVPFGGYDFFGKGALLILTEGIWLFEGLVED